MLFHELKASSRIGVNRTAAHSHPAVVAAATAAGPLFCDKQSWIRPGARGLGMAKEAAAALAAAQAQSLEENVAR